MVRGSGIRAPSDPGLAVNFDGSQPTIALNISTNLFKSSADRVTFTSPLICLVIRL